MKYSLAILALTVCSSASLLPRAATATTLPAHTGILVLPTVSSIPAGGSYDGKMQKIDTGRSCELDVDYGINDIVFILGEGATLSNVIIGPNQKRGIRCLGKCTLKNVWWAKVCDIGLAITSQKAADKTVITGGGAFSTSASAHGKYYFSNVTYIH